MKNNDKLLTKVLEAFRKQYPLTTSADLQTFIIGWNSAVKHLIEPLPKKCPICKSVKIKEHVHSYYCENCENI